MQASPSILGDALAHRCAQILYHCLELPGSTKGAFYLRREGRAAFELASHFGWPRGTQPPAALEGNNPLLLEAQRQRRTYAINETAGWEGLEELSQGNDKPRFLVTPVYHKGDWIGLLLQRDRNRGEAFVVERDEPPTLALCDQLVQALAEFGIFGPAHTPRQAPLGGGNGQGPGEKLMGFKEAEPGLKTLNWEGGIKTLAEWMAPSREVPLEQRPAGMVSRELREFFWGAAGLLSQILSIGALALWTSDPEEVRPLLVHSQLPLSPALQQQILTEAARRLPGVKEQELRVLSKVEMPEARRSEGAFTTVHPMVLSVGSATETGGTDLLLICRLEDHPFSKPELDIIEQTGRLLGLHVQEGRLHERYHRAFLSVSHRILKSSEGRLPHLRDHSLATARLARELALKLDLPSEEVEAVSIAAILHDVGTLLLDPKLMTKSTELDPTEMAKVRTHPELAEAFLRDLRFPFDVVKIIRHHHERVDGRGYPDGLRGEAIPMGSRIIHVIEAFEVMTSGKSYKSRRKPEAALEELTRNAGTQFDTAVVEAFSGLLGGR